MTFDQLIEYNIIKAFLEKPYTKPYNVAEKIDVDSDRRPFFKISKLSISLNQQSETLYSLLLMHVQAEEYQNILKLKSWTLAFTSYNVFFKKKKQVCNQSPFLLSVWFSLVTMYWFTKFNCLIAITSWYIKQYVYCN